MFVCVCVCVCVCVRVSISPTCILAQAHHVLAGPTMYKLCVCVFLCPSHLSIVCVFLCTSHFSTYSHWLTYIHTRTGSPICDLWWWGCWQKCPHTECPHKWGGGDGWRSAARWQCSRSSASPRRYLDLSLPPPVTSLWFSLARVRALCVCTCVRVCTQLYRAERRN